MTNQIIKILKSTGPTRSSVIVKKLVEGYNISAEAARQRVSRAKTPIMKFPTLLLPKNEKFIYLDQQYKSELFWKNFHNALRETNTIYALAIDGLINRGGIIEADEFAVISGAPLISQKQVCSDRVMDNLTDAGIIKKESDGKKEYISISCEELFLPNVNHCRTLRLTEGIILDGVREWARNLGLASYNKIVIRGDSEKREVGPFMWDLTGPSYILPVRGKKYEEGTLLGEYRQGSLVVDVFAQGVFKEKDIGYFVRKIKTLQRSLPNLRFMPILIAEGFDSQATNYGRREGIILATMNNIFGNDIAESMKMLIETLNNAAAVTAKNPEKLTKLLNQLLKIEGTTNNLRGVLFELICVYLAKHGGASVSYSVKATNPENGDTADIDILQVFGREKCTAIECKGKGPGGIVTLAEVQDWKRRLAIFLRHLNNREDFREASISFEIWTTGTFSPDALILLKKEKKLRITNPIDWKEGKDILDIAITCKEKGITDALKTHYLNHPLSSNAVEQKNGARKRT